MTNIKIRQTSLRTLKQSDQGFMLKDGVVNAPRAGFEIDQMCPKTYKAVIVECINNGWIKPVATVYDHELTFDTLKDCHV